MKLSIKDTLNNDSKHKALSIMISIINESALMHGVIMLNGTILVMLNVTVSSAVLLSDVAPYGQLLNLKRIFFRNFFLVFWRHDFEHNVTRHNDTRRNNDENETQHSCTQLYEIKFPRMLLCSVSFMLSI
jgi:hypothetical protein